MSAVGMIDGVIELWDLDVLDPVEPTCTLEVEKKHMESITSLSLNKQIVNLLASGSADKSIALWDINTNKRLQK